MGEQSFYSLLGEVSNDIAILADNPSLTRFVENPTGSNQKDIKRLFETTLNNKTSYFQIRWIGVANNGKEIIRFDRRNKRIFQSDTLQQKGDREYFQETLKLNSDEYYYSRIDLNQEYGVISEPYTPTLRAASPIIDNTQRKAGILVINVDMSKLYANLDQISRNSVQFYLVDQSGEYLYSPNRAEQFSQQKGKSNNFFSDFNVNDSNLNSYNEQFQSFSKDERAFLSYIKELEYFNGRRKIYLISSIDQKALMKSAMMVRSYSLRNLIIVCLFSLIASLIFTSFFSRKIRQITRAIVNYENGSQKIDLPVNRRDEIGVLANAFQKMKLRIDKNVRELNRSLKKEKEAKKQRDEFLQNMSHEMRTPLNSILGLTQILYKEAPKDSQLPIIDSIEKSANNLAGLVYDVLDHQKLVEGKLQMSFQAVDISRLLQDIYATYKFEAAQKSLKFNLNIDENLKEIRYSTDPLRLSQIVTNLVINAIKYTNVGNIDLNAERIKKNDRSYLKICVQDTGIGIGEENIKRINDRFFRENEDLSFRGKGYGLGLSIVKQLSDLFNGEFEAESIKDEGSRFTLIIPLKRCFGNTPFKVLPKKDILLPLLNNNYDILLIEDDLSTIELVKHLLTNSNIILRQVSSIEKVAEFLQEKIPDLIISDLILHKRSFKEAILQWMNSGKINCPVIIASALDPEDIASGDFIFFQKPYNVNVFKDYVYVKLAENEYLKPDFSNIYSDYDHDREKVKRVLKLLDNEFITYLDRIFLAYQNKDQKEWKAILHKLITHIHNLKLIELKENLPEEISKLNDTRLTKIRALFAFYVCCLRTERNVNLKDQSS